MRRIRPHNRPRTAVLFALTGVALGTLTAFFSAPITPWLLLGLLFLCALSLRFFRTRDPADPLILLILGTLFFAVIRLLVLLVESRSDTIMLVQGIPITWGEFVAAALLYVGGLAALGVGLWLKLPARPPPLTINHRSAKAVTRVVAVLFILGLVARLILVLHKGVLADPANIFANRALNNLGLGPLWYASRLTLLAYIVFFLGLASSWRPPRTIALLALVSAPTVLLLNHRGGVLFVVLSGLAIAGLTGHVSKWVTLGRRRPKKPAAVALILFALLLAWGPIRGIIGHDHDPVSSLGAVWSTAASFDYFTELYLDRADRWQPSYGRLTAGEILYPIPRTLWDSKPTNLGYGAAFTDAFYPWLLGSNTLTAGYPGYLYMEGGTVVLLAGSFLLGLGIAGLRSFTIAPRPPTDIRRHVAILAYILIIGQFAQLQQDGLSAIIGALTRQLPLLLPLTYSIFTFSSNHDGGRPSPSTSSPEVSRPPPRRPLGTRSIPY